MNLSRDLEENQIHWDLSIHHNERRSRSYRHLKYDQNVHALKRWPLNYIHFLLRWSQDLDTYLQDQLLKHGYLPSPNNNSPVRVLRVVEVLS